jgi:hypothetical protein
MRAAGPSSFVSRIECSLSAVISPAPVVMSLTVRSIVALLQGAPVE